MAPEQRRTHHPDDFPQELTLAAQTAFDFSHEVFRQPQVIEGLLEGLSGPLRLAAIACKALVRGAAATLSGFRVFFDGSCGGRHGALLLVCGSVAVGVCPRARDTCPSRLCTWRHLGARARRTSS